MRFNSTQCCALGHLCEVSNHTKLEDLQEVLEVLKRNKESNWEVGISTGRGQTAVFTIVSPGEDLLEKNLKTLGFKKVHTFERRKGYPKTGDLKMYIKNL